MNDWPTIEEVKATEDKKRLVAMGIVAWGNCYIETPPLYFGELLILIGKKLGLEKAATYENLVAYANSLK